MSDPPPSPPARGADHTQVTISTHPFYYYFYSLFFFFIFTLSSLSLPFARSFHHSLHPPAHHHHHYPLTSFNLPPLTLPAYRHSKHSEKGYKKTVHCITFLNPQMGLLAQGGQCNSLPRNRNWTTKEVTQIIITAVVAVEVVEIMWVVGL